VTKVLQLAPDLALPLDAATRRLGILAMSGAGKSNVAVVMAEQMFDAGIPWVAIDPKGDWWGVRSSRSGKGPGLPVPIFGGLHGDVPLEPTAGKLIGEMLVEQRLTCVLDVSEFEERQGMWAFLSDLGSTLLKRNRQVLHLFLEECDEYLPQKPGDKGNLLRCLGIWQRVVKRGRFRGLGTTQITQRNASLNKDTLYQAEALIAMRVTGKGDRDAIKGWVEHHNAAAEIVTSLPTLADGEGWLTSPAWLRETKRVRFARRRTFDSGGTPVLLEGNAPPATLADVDLDQLRTRMAATIEKAKADDPTELRRKIAGLERDLAAERRRAPAPVQTSAPSPTNTAELRQAQADARQLQAHNDRLTQALERLMKFILEVNAQDFFKAGGEALDPAAVQKAIDGAAQQLVKLVAQDLQGRRTAFERWRKEGEELLARISRLVKQDVKISVAVKHNELFTVTPRTAAPRERPTPPPADGSFRPGTSQQRILNALRWLETIGLEEADKSQVALLSDQSPTSGGYFNNLGTLRTAGLIEYPRASVLCLTDAGRAFADPGSVPSSSEELHEQLYAKLGPSKAAILKAAIAVYPDPVPKPELAERASGILGKSMSPTSGGYFNNLGTLRSLKLIDYPSPGSVVASRILFLDGR
jgi:hypothetical protein